MKSWLWVHDLCKIFAYFSFDWNPRSFKSFLHDFHIKIFFNFKSYKRKTRSRLEPVLRASFVINLKTFENIFFHIFHIKKFFYCGWNEKVTRSKWEPVLRGSFVIVSNNTKYNFLSIILPCFSYQNICLSSTRKEQDPNEKLVFST